MARSIRFIRRNVQGRVRQNFNFGPITQRSAVVITAAELGEGGRPHLGEANVWVTNVGPHNPEGGPVGGVEFHIHSDFSSPINVLVTISVLEDIEGDVFNV
jgi:hypothetical protein